MLDLSALTPVDLHYQVGKLLSDYVECIDDDRLEEWPDLFVEDCLYQVIARENADRGLPTSAMYCDSRGMLRDRVVALRHANIYAKHYYRHVLSNVNVKGVQDGEVLVQSNYVVLQTLVEGDTKVFNAGKYLDRIVATPDGLRFRRKVVVFDTYRIPNLLVTPL
ncbi:aromatic-ring-hydroxylating dioxygenase subunit beta [Immundisolibacter sp.]|jgi:anthranilate 1,2-dioxygenase small subunit|uniref:aromatic-ring-hydroxylating dioxygenase subunit beta n=1 Tax=Immundisolibacter sp. TaxID=1934948 RepID=UPI002B0B0AB0|nr:aromatic-ring-hydroxylating dioxygenase subunit beta [Immundisolibacter sp.]MEA3220856.1 Anthranilate 1,2-dioxygenase small subunit [Immundisolibacter sp.]